VNTPSGSAAKWARAECRRTPDRHYNVLGVDYDILDDEA
jgi:hypothetical protein